MLHVKNELRIKYDKVEAINEKLRQDLKDK